MRNVLGPSLAAIVVACCFVACSRSGHDALSNASTIPPDAAEISALRISAEAEFTGNILPFWMKNAPDVVNGGFHGFVGDDLKPDPAAERGALLDTRILWTFSGAYLTTGRRVYLDMAARAYSDLQSRFFDAKSGGYFWAARPDGTISDPRKMLYVQAFAIYALSQYHRATGDRDALKNAIDLYRLVEEKCRDRVNGGYFEEFDSQWNPISARAPGDSPLGATDQKSQNVHLHMMEAYTGLYRIWPDRTLAADLAALHDLMLDRVYNADTRHLGLFFSNDWKCSSQRVSFGHDIEFSWLLCESAEVLGDVGRIDRARKAAVDIATAVASSGLDTDGGLFNEGDAKGVISDPDKDWWPQAEAALGFLNAWRISGDARFFRLSESTWNFIRFRVSAENGGGDWFGRLDKRGRPIPGYGRISFWKGPYHNGRACMEIMQKLQSVEDIPARAGAR